MTDAKARLLQMIADEPHMGGGGLLKAVGKAQKVAKKAETGARAILPAAERDANLAKMLEGSKVKERLYHGTGRDIKEFDKSKLRRTAFGEGFHLAESPNLANFYANQFDEGQNVMPVHAAIKNPYDLKNMHDWYDVPGDSDKDKTNFLKSQGYDGVKYPHGAGGDKTSPAPSVYVAFEPTQIKSAIGNRGTYDLTDPDINKAGGGAVHMAGGGRTPKYPWERYPQPKKVPEMRARQISPIAGAVKKGADYATQLIDKGPSFSSLVGNLVGAVPFVGPDLRKRMEASDISIPTDFTFGSNMPDEDYEYGQPMQYKKPGISTTSVPTKDVLEALNVSDLVGTPGLSKVAEDIGYGQMPDPLDLLDAASAAALGYGAIKGGLKGAQAAKQGALSAAKAAERFAEKKVPEVMESGGLGAQMLGAFGQNTQSNVIKGPGGNWISGSVEQALKPLKRGNYDIPQYIRDDLGIEDLTPQELAINKWVDSNLTNYVKKQMATPGDPVRKLAEEGIVHIPSEQVGVNRYRAPQHREAYGGQQLGESEAAKAWEDASDVAINAPKAKTIKENESLYQANPWVDKLSNEDRVFTLGNPAPHSVGMAANLQPIHGLGFDHIVDVLNQDLAAGRIRPEQLNKISMEQAVRRTYEFDQEMAKKMRETQAKVTEGMPVYKEYPEGYKWIELAQPKNMKLPEGYSVKPDPIRNQKTGAVDNNSYRLVDNEGKLVGWGQTEDEAVSAGLGEKVLKDALKYEGDTMGHCVGGYCPDVIEGKSRIFSLRDAKGEPHVTIETRPKKMTAGQWFQNLPEEEKLATAKDITGKGYSGREEDYPPYQEWLKNAPENIIQIKGKQNRAPKEDYLPFVQDFVKSGQWSDVGDLRNTGLRDIKNTPKVEEYLKSKNADVPRYLTEDEYKRYESDFLLDELGKAAENDPLTQRLLNEQPRMAAGGAVSDAKQRLLDMIAEEPHMAGGGVLKAVAKAQKTAKKAKMYSAVDKALEASKRGAGTGMEFANELAKTSGIKKAELVDRGIMVPSKNGPVLNPALTQLPKMTKQDFVSHLNEKYKPPGVRKISITDPKLTDEVIDKKAMQMMADDVNDYVNRHGDADYDDVFDSRYNNDYDQYFERAKEALSEDVGTKYSQYKLPGGENYRENLYQYENPTGKAFLQSHFDEPNVMYHMRQTDRIEPTYTSAQIDEIGQRMADAMGTKVENLASGAPILMMQKGVISPLEAAQFSHAKGFQNMDIDMSPAQKRALHIEEIQSDWHQKGRKGGYANETAYQEVRQKADDVARAAGYQDAFHAAEGWKIHGIESAKEASDMLDEASKFKSVNSVPDAPFKNNWYELALKQALMDAAEGDYNQLLITPGAKQAERYSLKNVLDSLSVGGEQNGVRQVSWMPVGQRTDMALKFDKNGVVVQSMLPELQDKHLSDVFGKEMAEKIMGAEPYQRFEGLDLEVGGKGMESFYDQMVPSYLNDIGKKYGVRVGERAIEGDVPYSKTTPTLADVQRLAQEMYGVSDIQAISALPLEQRNAINQAFADKVRAEHTTKLHSFDITPEMREDILNNGLPMYQRGGEVHMGIGGVPGAINKAQTAAKAAKKAAEMAAKAAKVAEVVPYLPGVHYADPLLPPNMRLSEALGNAGAEGKTLNFTETDRSRVFGPNRGGAGFAGLQHYSLPHKEANTVWGFGSKEITKKKINKNDPENTIWTTYAGSPTQHKSNTVVVKDALGQLQAADKSGLVNPKQIEFINDRIRSALSKNGKPLFPKDFDITDPKAFDFATTFDRRAAISDALMGIGIKKPMISKEFKAANPGVQWQDAANIEAILRRETDPAMMGANTNDVGPNLFVMDNGIIHRPDLNEAFPYQVTGTDLGMRYDLTPFRDAAPDWIKARGIKPNEPINAWAMSRAAPSQFVSDKYLTGLQKKGRKEGGLAQIKKVKRHGNTVSN